MNRKRSIIWTMDKEDLGKLVDVSKSITELLKNLGYKNGGGAVYVALLERCKQEGIDINRLAIKGRRTGGKRGYNRRPLEEVLVENSDYTRASLKVRLVSERIIEYKCEVCGNSGEWLGKPVSLILDHINGINNDNRIENLRFLCPNCNAQTDTFCGKNANLDNFSDRECLNCNSIFRDMRSGDRSQRKFCSLECYDNYRKNKTADGKNGIFNLVCHQCGCDYLSTDKDSKYCSYDCSHLSQRKVERPSEQELLDMLESGTPWCTIGREFGVSDNAVRKWARVYGIDPKDYSRRARKSS